ncbi:alpha/beta fold hydrolase [Actinomadura luzonensis]
MIDAARPATVPAPVPVSTGLPLIEATPTLLAERYATSRGDIQAAERTAAQHGDRRRAVALHVMAGAERQFLSFDGRDGGRTVEVLGDLAAAEHIAVLVPGADTHLDKYGLLHGGALRLRQALGNRYAVVAWLGYRTPATVSFDALTAGQAEEGAVALRAFVRQLSAANGGGARVSLVCHSYGTVVCGRAAPGLDVARIVLTGSPGIGADDVGALRTRATIWAARGSRDWIDAVPNTQLHLPFVTLGFGPDPVSPAFGARVFAAGQAAHSDYLTAGSLSLHNIARIIAGQDPVQTERRPMRAPSRAAVPGRGTVGSSAQQGAGGVSGHA